MEAMEQRVHQGRNIKKLREMLGIKQETLASELGWNQKKMSVLEQKEHIDLPVLEKVSTILKVPVEVIKNFDEDRALQFISNTVNNSDNATMYGPFVFNSFPNFNPVEKWIETLEEIRKLNEEKTALYERMLEDKESLIQRLEALLNR